MLTTTHSDLTNIYTTIRQQLLLLLLVLLLLSTTTTTITATSASTISLTTTPITTEIMTIFKRGDNWIMKKKKNSISLKDSIQSCLQNVFSKLISWKNFTMLQTFSDASE